MTRCCRSSHVGAVLQMKVKVKPVGVVPVITGTTLRKPLTPAPATSPRPSPAQPVAASPGSQLIVSTAVAVEASSGGPPAPP